MEAIGTVRNDIQEPTDEGWGGVISEVVLDEKFADGLDGNRGVLSRPRPLLDASGSRGGNRADAATPAGATGYAGGGDLRPGRDAVPIPSG